MVQMMRQVDFTADEPLPGSATQNLASNVALLMQEMFGQGAEMTDIDLSTNNLSWLPPSVSRLSGLTRLNVSDNSLLSVPTELMRCDGQQPRGPSARNVYPSQPLSMYRLKQLKSLNVSYILASALPGFLLDMEGLEELNAYGNPLGEFPQLICSLRNLRTLVRAHYSTPVMSSQKAQHHLCCSPYSLQTPCCTMAWGLPTNNLTARMSLRGQHLAKTGLKALPNEIGRLESLEELILCYNNIAELPEGMSSLHRLKKLRCVSGHDVQLVPNGETFQYFSAPDNKTQHLTSKSVAVGYNAR
jgi:Leucine-rich repeat (LRR) protein